MDTRQDLFGTVIPNDGRIPLALLAFDVFIFHLNFFPSRRIGFNTVLQPIKAGWKSSTSPRGIFEHARDDIAGLAAVGCIGLGEPMRGDQEVQRSAVILDPPRHTCGRPSHAPCSAASLGGDAGCFILAGVDDCTRDMLRRGTRFARTVRQRAGRLHLWRSGDGELNIGMQTYAACARAMRAAILARREEITTLSVIP